MHLLRSLKVSLTLTSALSTIAAGQIASYGPGGFAVYASDTPFIAGPAFYLRPSDGLFLVQNPTGSGVYPLSANYNPGPGYNPYGVAPGPCSPLEACYLVFQSDGNLVEYYNGVPVWQTGTSGRGAVLTFYQGVVFAQITDANSNVLWASNPPITIPGGCYGPPDQCP